MSRKLMNKVMGFIGFDDEIVDDEEIKEERRNKEVRDSNSYSPRKKGQVVNLHSQRQDKVIVTEPQVFEDVKEIADNLKNRFPVIINLEEADAELAKRIIDFISGTAYALDGRMQKVGNGIFLFVPSNMDISSAMKEQLKEKGMFSWIRQ